MNGPTFDEYLEEFHKTHPWRTYDEWRELYPTTIFILHNQSMHVEEAFPPNEIRGMRASIPTEQLDNNEIWFDTIRWDTHNTTKTELVEMTQQSGADEVHYDESNEWLEVWYD